MEYVPISFKTDYSLLKSIIKIKDVVECSKRIGATYAGVLDDNPYAIMDFYDKCCKVGLKPVFGMVVKIGDNKIYLYIKDYAGYQNLLKINESVQDKSLTFEVLSKYNSGLICVLPYENYNLYNRFKPVFEVYLGYKSHEEKIRAESISKAIVFIKEIKCFKAEEINLLKIVNKIGGIVDDNKEAYIGEIEEADRETIENFVKKVDLKFEFDRKYIPAFTSSKEESWKLLYSLSNKGLEKRLSGKVTTVYKERLEYELSVIKDMGFVDYFLIVYDYVKFAKKNGIYVGPGRGSAAGALVSYTLGITDVDPLKYDLLFERFLNPERVTMPDIDIDFEDTRRGDVIDYVRKKYGSKRVSLIIAYGTMAARAALRDVSKVLEIDSGLVDKMCKMVDAKKSLKDNLINKELVEFIRINKLEKVYKISMRLEGLKKNTTIHAAGVIISSIPIVEIAPTLKTSDGILAGYTMEYLERLGLLKMDFLALRNLAVIHKSVDAIKKQEPDFDLKNIPLTDTKTYKLLGSGDTDNIFQFDTPGMRTFLKKLQPENFDDIIAAVALFRPGPMDNIDEYIRRRKGEVKVTYLHEDLKPILENTYGIIVYQEQIMQILSKMGGYSYAEADLIRRAMSKKKREVMFEERTRFISKSLERGYDEDTASKVYDLIVKFANYGFNKSHSMAYALIGYQMAYMKVNYPSVYQANTLNMSIGSDAKIKDVIEDAKNKGMKIVRPSIQNSDRAYKVVGDTIILPLSSIKNVSSVVSNLVVDNQPYSDFFDFFKKLYGKGITRSNIESLIWAGAMSDFGSVNTLLSNIDSAITYVELVGSLDESLVAKPALVVSEELEPEISEIDIFGFYVSGHPSSKYNDGVIKIKNFATNLNRECKVAVIVDKMKIINTKKGEKMAFLEISDDTGSSSGVVFPKYNSLIDKIEEGNLYVFMGTISKRGEDVQFIVEKLVDSESLTCKKEINSL